MTQTTRTKEAPVVLVVDSVPGAETHNASWSADVESVKPTFRDRLASLEAHGLLAIGVRAILQDNGFSMEAPAQHCGCPDCARRCAMCADRR